MPIDQLTRLGTVRTIVRWGQPVLHRPADPVTDFGDDLQSLLSDIFATNTAAHGAGLAAPQIGVGLTAFVYDCLDADLRRHVGVVCNPVVELTQGSERQLEVWEEGCLSLPGGYADLARPNLAVCRGQDQYGHDVEITGTGQLARCFQHETDHLQGIVFGDRLPLRRRRGLDETHRQAADRYPTDWPVSPSS
jgi:peptide deformylase